MTSKKRILLLDDDHLVRLLYGVGLPIFIKIGLDKQ